MSSRLAGDKRTIIEKAQQLKEVQNLEVPKGNSKKNPTFSLFNNPSFISVASSIGVEMDKVDNAKSSNTASNTDRIQDRTVGTIPRSILAYNNTSEIPPDSPANYNDGLWSLICKHRQYKHPMNRDSS